MIKLIAIDENALHQVNKRLSAIEQLLETVAMKPRASKVTVAEYAQMHDVSEGTVRRWIKAGKIKTDPNAPKRMVML